MSDKRRFIQQAATHFLPHLDWNLDQAIRYAERLWQRLDERGYGATERKGPRPIEDWYGRLTPRQRDWFDRFWKAYAYKKGKQGAAMRWHQLGELTDEDYERIVRAADAEAKRELPQGQVRKMAQGWLTERRWEDHQENAESQPSPIKAQIVALSADLAHARRMAATGNEFWQQEADRLTQRLDALRSL